jgi:hypothetical protein
VSEIFHAAPEDGAYRDALTITGRQLKPRTDELLISVQHGHLLNSVPLSRPTVRNLYAVLGQWLEEGWPDVAHTDARQVGAA